MISKYYVTMTDKFMSGWGRSDNRINKLVIECDSYDEALIVCKNARRRSEMRYVNICYHKPYYNQKYYYTSYSNKTDGKAWFIDQPDWY